MRDNGKTMIFQGIHRRQILLISETAPDLPQRIVVNGLQTKFYPDRFLAVQFGEQIEHFVWETVTACCDGECSNIRLCDRLRKKFS